MMYVYQERAVPSDRSGIALVSVLLALALVGTIAAALAAIGTVELRTAANHRSATRALHAADAGATHALALMRGPLSEYSYSELLVGADGVSGTADDGVLAGFAVSESDALPDTGVVLGAARYFVTVANDASDPSGSDFVDENHRLVARCRGTTADAGRAEVGVVLAAPAFPAIVSNGDLVLPGNPDVLGPCAGVHANGTLTAQGSPVVDGPVSASQEIVLSGTITDASGAVVTPEANAPEIHVPDLSPFDYCGAADYVLRDGWVITVGPPRDSAFAGAGKVNGWQWSASDNTYTMSGRPGPEGTVCAYGNVSIGGNIGRTGDPFEITILATGSVKVAGNPALAAAHSDDVLIVAEGDVRLSGTASGITPAYAGMIYAGSQCQFNGTPGFQGHVLCYDAPDPPGSVNLTDENKFNGTPTVTYDCSGQRRRTQIASWWEVRAS